MKLVIFCYNFRPENLRLMPWRYIAEVARGINCFGHRAIVLSAEPELEESVQCEIDGISVSRIPGGKLGLFVQKSHPVLMAADHVIWSASRLTFLNIFLLKSLDKPLSLLFTGPLYGLREALEARRQGVPLAQLRTHIKQALMPLQASVMLINTCMVRCAFVLSAKNADILTGHGAEPTKIHLIPPGYDGIRGSVPNAEEIVRIKKRLNLPENRQIVLYFGSLNAVRGLPLLLKAFVRVKREIDTIQLVVLARTNSRTEIEELNQKVRCLGMENYVTVVSGVLGKDRVFEYLLASKVVALPFVLVPSDMPIGALEAMAIGKPVITTDIDGMPELVHDRGVVVSPQSNELADAILRCCKDCDLYQHLSKNALSFMNSYPTWRDVTERFMYSVTAAA